MKQKEISELADATCAWLAYKALTGFEHVLNEAMLAVPISEFLGQRTMWDLTTELAYRKLAQKDELGIFWCDFAGRKSGGETQFILETKFLKRPIRALVRHVASDVIRLSLPPGERLVRLFLLAGKSDHFENDANHFLFQRLFDLGVRKGCDIDLGEALLDGSFLKFSPGLQEALSVRKDLSASVAYVDCRAITYVAGFKVIIWSVKRARLRTAAGSSSVTQGSRRVE